MQARPHHAGEAGDRLGLELVDGGAADGLGVGRPGGVVLARAASTGFPTSAAWITMRCFEESLGWQAVSVRRLSPTSSST